jgi:ribonuclease HI
MPSPSEILLYLAEHEPLDATLRHFPELSRPLLVQLLRQAASSLPASAANALATREEQPPPSASAATSTGAATKKGVGQLKRARIYSDGASRGNPGPAGAGAVIMDAETGKVVELLKRYLGKQTNNVAEYEAVLLGLRRARELGVSEVEVVADSQLMIRQLGGQYRVKNEGIRPLYESAVKLLQGFAKVRLVHVPREMNTLADEMSNRAIDER